VIWRYRYLLFSIFLLLTFGCTGRPQEAPIHNVDAETRTVLFAVGLSMSVAVTVLPETFMLIYLFWVLKWTPSSRPFLSGNKLIVGGSEFEFQAASATGPPGHSGARSGAQVASLRSPTLRPSTSYCKTSHSGPKAVNPRGSGTASPSSTTPFFLIDCPVIRDHPCAK